MDKQYDPIINALKVRVSSPHLVQQGIVDVKTVALVVRFLMNEIIASITGGSPVIEWAAVGFSEQEESL